ncbi:ATP-binding protein [Bacillus sp. M6-12]|uniref:ATP-binding protein n=1 Tax=Bacillus sp. M6-12 TaxID=2054166 RepID=UPI000C788E35|nr:ATP-binding protein [Bacillus sp. M6-12]PLS19738.1 ATP-binding protein [Bacillus sp. M6-12]
MTKSYVVGKTDEREVFVASLDRAFVLNEYLIVDDNEHSSPVGEVIETVAYEKVTEHTFSPESGIKESLDTLFDYQKSNNVKVYIGRLKMLQEHQTPIAPHSELKIPEFKEIGNLLVNTSPKKGFSIGVINGTQTLHEHLPEEIKNVAPLFNAKAKKVIDQNGVPFLLDYFSFKEYPHIGLFGGSGSGKTFGLRVICEEIMEKGIPGILFDPHFELDFSTTMTGLEEKYRFNYSSKYELFEVGEDVGINFAELNSGELLSLLEFVGELSQPMRGAVEALHEKHDSFTTLSGRINKLKKAFENMEKPERERETLDEDVALLYVKFKDRVAGATTLQAISWRLDQLENTGLFNHDVSSVESALINRKLAVIRGSQTHLRMIASYLIGKMYRKRRLYKDWQQMNNNKRANGKQPTPFPPFFVAMDEAHNFAPNGNSSNPTKRILREIAQEARKYGVFEIFGTQRPALLDTTITAQLNTKIIFRTGIKEDMEMIEKETNLNDDQVKRLPELTSGNAFVSSATLNKTMYIRFRTTKTESPHGKNPFDELDDFNNSDKLKGILKELLPLSDTTIQKVHSQINQKMSKAMSIKEIQETLEEMAQYGEIKKEKSPFGSRYTGL